MKLKFLIIAITLYLSSSMHVLSASNDKYEITEERYKKICKWGIFNPPECKKRVIRSIPKKVSEQPEEEKIVSNESTKSATGALKDNCLSWSS